MSEEVWLVGHAVPLEPTDAGGLDLSYLAQSLFFL